MLPDRKAHHNPVGACVVRQRTAGLACAGCGQLLSVVSSLRDSQHQEQTRKPKGQSAERIDVYKGSRIKDK